MSFLLVLALSLAWAAPAAADRSLNERIVSGYVKSGGRLDACKFTQDELKSAKNDIPEDLKQYGAALIAALDDAIAARAQGACDKRKQQAQAPAVADQAAPPGGQPPAPSPSTGTPAAPSTATPAAPAPAPAQAQAQPPPTPTAEPSPVTSIARDDSIALASATTEVATDPPFPVLALAILAALLAAAALAFGFVRWFAWEPAWAVRLRHCAGEAGWRASSTFSEFADFVRLGR